jgi:hypothetical protein
MGFVFVWCSLSQKRQFLAEVVGQPIAPNFKTAEHMFHEDIVFKQIDE